MFRIICLGDSCTYGSNVDWDQTYPARLQVVLNNGDDEPRIEVLNAGVSGYTSYQGFRYLQEDLIRYKPDLVTLYFGPNDMRTSEFFDYEFQPIHPRVVTLAN